MRTILFLLLVLPSCVDEAQAVGLVSKLPPQERIVVEPREPKVDLCCYDVMCVQPRVEQDACDPGTVAVSCATQRLSVLGPLWECRS